MWISRREYERLLTRNAELEGRSGALTETVTALKTTLDWARVRLTQVEHERNQLLFNFTGVKVLTPSIEEAPKPKSSIQSAVDDVPNFEDVGDEEAARLGLGWRDDGTVLARPLPE